MKTIKNPEELWELQKAKLQLIFTQLNPEDFHYDYGRKDVMLNQLQVKLGISRDELNEILVGL